MAFASQANRIPPSLPKPHCKPLQPKNFAAIVVVSATAAAFAATICSEKEKFSEEEQKGKENLQMKGLLEEDLEAARLRTEKLRWERASGEEKMREMDSAFERWIIGAENRLNELLVAEMDIKRVLHAKKYRASCLKSSAFISLRAREGRKRWQASESKEIGNAAGKRISESSGSKKKGINIFYSF